MRDKYKSAWAKKQAAKKKSNPKKYQKKTNARLGRGRRRLTVLPTKIVARPGYLSESRCASVRKPSPSVLAMERVGAPQIYSETSITSNRVIPNGNWWVSMRPHLDILDLQRVISGQAITGANSGVNCAVLESYTSILTYANAAQTACELELYDIVPKRDISVLTQINVNGIAYNVSGNPSNYVAAGVAAALGQPSPVTNSQFAMAIGESPFDSTFFKTYFKVVKRTIIQLTPGAQHRHVVSQTPHRKITQDMPYNNQISGWANLSAYTLAVWRPYLGGIQSGATTSYGTLGASVLDLQTKRMKWTYVVNQQEQLVRVLLTNPVPGAKSNTILPQTSVQVTGAVDMNGTIL